MFDVISVIAGLDVHLQAVLDDLAENSKPVEIILNVFLGSPLVKGLIPVLLIWWVWMRPHPDQDWRRRGLVVTFFVAGLASLCGRILAKMLPFRMRPELVDAMNPGYLPTMSREGLETLGSSFPSDHAMFYFSIATCLFLISRPVGWWAYFHALFAVCLPRIILDRHYPGDILAGAILGIMFARLTFGSGMALVDRLPKRWQIDYLDKTRPEMFYPAMFFATFCLATMFQPLLDSGKSLRHLISVLIRM